MRDQLPIMALYRARVIFWKTTNLPGVDCAGFSFAALRLSLVAAMGVLFFIMIVATSHCGAPSPRAQALGTPVSVAAAQGLSPVVARGPEQVWSLKLRHAGFNCLQHVCNPPDPGTEPASSAEARRILSTYHQTARSNGSWRIVLD